MIIKLATKEDFELFVPAKIEFNKEYGISEKSEDFILKEFEDYLRKGAVILAIEDNKVIGYLLGLIEEDMYEKYGYIGEIFTLNEFRGKGVSTKLKDKFIEFLKSNKINLCRLEVNPDNPVQEAYQKWGFKVDKYRMSLKIE